MRLPWPPFFPPSAPGRPRSTLQKLVPSANRSCPAKGQGDAATSRTTNTNEGNSSRSAIPLSRPSGAAFAQSCSLLASGLGRGLSVGLLDLGQRPTEKTSFGSWWDAKSDLSHDFPASELEHPRWRGGEGGRWRIQTLRLRCRKLLEAVDKRRDAKRQGAGREASVPSHWPAASRERIDRGRGEGFSGVSRWRSLSLTRGERREVRARRRRRSRAARALGRGTSALRALTGAE